MTATSEIGAPAAAGGTSAGQSSAQGAGAQDARTPDWTQGLDPGLRTVVETKGWKTPGDALASYVALEKTLGAEKLALPPKGKDGGRDFASWDGWKDLGRPEKPDDYRFTAPEGRELTDVDQALLGAMRPTLHQAGLAQWQTDVITKAFQGHALAIEQAAAQRAEQDRAALQREWGNAFDANIERANRVLRVVFGDELDAAKQIQLADGRFLLDDARLARGLAEIGGMLGEDGELGPGTPRPGMPTTPAAAQAEIERIRGEAFENPKHAYNDRNHPEHAALHQRVLELYRIAGGGR